MSHHQSDDSAVAIGCFILTILLVIMFYIATPAKSQEAPPSGMPCGPSDKMQTELQNKYGEVIVGGGFVGSNIIVITTNPKSGSFTIMSMMPNGQACLLIGGQGFAIADPAAIKGDAM